MNHIHQKHIQRVRRHSRIRARVVGTKERPRLAIYKSNRYVNAQIIDDSHGATLFSGSTQGLKGTKMETAKKLGGELARKAQAAGVTAVVFDRGGFRYTGRVAVLADAARAAGLKL